MAVTASDSDKLTDFEATCEMARETLVKWQDFWAGLIEFDIEVPHDAAYSASGCRYVNVTQYDNNSNELDTEATRKMFARVIKWALANGYQVNKNYKDDEFNIVVDGIPEPVHNIEFYTSRSTVCTQVKVGEETVIRPIYEYNCEKIAFTAIDPS